LRSFHAIRNLALFFLFCVVIAGCGDGGKARYDLEPLSAEKAVELLERAGGDSERANAVIERVRASRTADFSFPEFWSRLSTTQAARRLTPEQRNRLLSLHNQSCKDVDFDGFAQFVLNLGDGYDFILGELRQCQTALRPERTRDFLMRMIFQREFPRLSEEERATFIERQEGDTTVLRPRAIQTVVSRFVMNELLRAPEAQGWDIFLCYLSPVELTRITEGLRERDKGALADRFATIYSNSCLSSW
jgi:hypothetical protein